MKSPFSFLALSILFCLVSACAQLKQIDRSKLPQDEAVQQVYADLLPIDQFARTYEQTWQFPVPKLEVASRFQAVSTH